MSTNPSDDKIAALDRLADLLGPGGWLTDSDQRAPYEREWRGYWTGDCLGVARPTGTKQTAETVRIASAAGLAMVPHGGNTGLVGGGLPHGGIVISTERMTDIRMLDDDNMTMTVDAGCVLADIQQAADNAGLLFPLSLGAEGSCRIGGNISTNAGGVGVLRYGNTRDLILGLEVVLPNGDIWDGLRGLRKDNTGYDLKQLFIGAEGTLGIITAATLKLFPKPNETVTALCALEDWRACLSLFNRLQRECGDSLTAFEAMARAGVALAVDKVPDVTDPFAEPAEQYALIELTSARRDAGLQALAERALADALEKGIVGDVVVAQSDAQRAALWRIREGIPEAQPKAGGSIKHDISVPVSAVPTFIDAAGKYVREKLPGVIIVAFGHLGDGNIHYNLTQPPDMNRDDFMANWSEVTAQVHQIACDLGGSFSAEHGIGEIKRAELGRLRPAMEIDLMRRIKLALDPTNVMNPGKILPDGDSLTP